MLIPWWVIPICFHWGWNLHLDKNLDFCQNNEALIRHWSRLCFCGKKSHSIHVWYIYLHLVDLLLGTSIGRYIVNFGLRWSLLMFAVSKCFVDKCFIRWLQFLPSTEARNDHVVSPRDPCGSESSVNVEYGIHHQTVSDVFLWHFWTVGRFDAGCCVCFLGKDLVPFCWAMAIRHLFT